jgi:hypothetical protein
MILKNLKFLLGQCKRIIAKNMIFLTVMTMKLGLWEA